MPSFVTSVNLGVRDDASDFEELSGKAITEMVDARASRSLHRMQRAATNFDVQQMDEGDASLHVRILGCAYRLN